MDIAGNTVYLTTLNPQGTRGTHNKLNSMEEPPSDTNTIPIQIQTFYFYFYSHNIYFLSLAGALSSILFFFVVNTAV
jgi:hypothetical protein